jgi:riboflavin synthase
MFTGIIERMGVVASIKNLTLRINVPRGRYKLGESVSVDGVCLTVSKIERAKKGVTLQFDLSEETLSKTTLGELKAGDHVNTETPLTLQSLVGGHLVTGHVEAIGEIEKREELSHSSEVWFSIPPVLMKYVVPKGSVTVNGVSLTVVNTSQDAFSVSLVPYTASHTNLGRKEAGGRVNIETDILSKYLEHFMNGAKS